MVSELLFEWQFLALSAFSSPCFPFVSAETSILKGQIWAEVVRMDKRLVKALGTLRGQVHGPLQGLFSLLACSGTS